MTFLAALPPHSSLYHPSKPSMANLVNQPVPPLLLAPPPQKQPQGDQQDQQRPQYEAMFVSSPSMSTKHSSNPLDDKSTPDPSMTMHHDSMVTVRLSAPSPSVKTSFGPDSIPPTGKSLLASEPSPREYIPRDAMAEAVREEEELDGGHEEEQDTPILGGGDIHQRSLQDELEETGMQDELLQQSPRQEQEQEEQKDQEEEQEIQPDVLVAQEQPASDEDESDSEEEVNWDQLQQTEEEQSRDPEADNSTAMLLSRLEQENNKLAVNPKMANIQSPPPQATKKARPPSMAQLRQMVTGPTPQALRYSMLPPPAMTDLEFYTALVQDYEQTVARLPTLVANKIRKGIPPPLRGVVWQSMSRARDAGLGAMYDQLCGESSPFEKSIGKDLGRTFPGVEMFRDPEGNGQQMLGRVLKCFSLYDPKIGYCQGLAFIVGPLLMHMPDKQAFCILVRLMERYDIRNCFLPELPGLHVRIYQFSELLRQNLPILSNHLQDLRVEPIYVSQWFLSFFAVTCPLPMLFRIYDVVFAEGASETIMRVALSLMRKNQARILACTEFEDVMQLLLSRGLWDCYHYNADEFVDDFVELSNVVTGDSLKLLEEKYNQANQSATNQQNTANAAQLPSDVTTAASRFLGRLWANSPKLAAAPVMTGAPITTATSSSPATANNTNFNTLSPGLIAPPRPLSMLKRSASKQSLASTLNSMEVSSSSVVSTASTDATSLSRDSSNTDNSSTVDAPTRATAAATKSFSNTTNAAIVNGRSNTSSETKYLNSQIEDLLTALSELQRTQALLAAELEQEQEERAESKTAVKSLLDGLRAANSSTDSADDSSQALAPEQLNQLVAVVEQRFGLVGQIQFDRRSSLGPTQNKTQLREDLERTKERLAIEEARGTEGKRRILDLQNDITKMTVDLKNSHEHTRVLHADKQRLEKQIHAMRVRASTSPHVPDIVAAAAAPDTSNRQSTVITSGPVSGLREFKLGRSQSTPTQAPQYNKRTSSMPRGGDSGGATVSPVSAPANEHEALLMQLVQAKTAEAIAKQEAEESRAKHEQLRRQFGLSSHGDGSSAPTQVQATASAAASAAQHAASNAASAAMGVFGRLTAAAAQPSSTAATTTPSPPTPLPPSSLTTMPTAAAPKPVAPVASGGGGFWGWRR